MIFSETDCLVYISEWQFSTQNKCVVYLVLSTLIQASITEVKNGLLKGPHLSLFQELFGVTPEKVNARCSSGIVLEFQDTHGPDLH